MFKSSEDKATKGIEKWPPSTTPLLTGASSCENSGVTRRDEVRQLPQGAKRQGALGGAFGRRIVCFALQNSAEFLKRERS